MGLSTLVRYGLAMLSVAAAALHLSAAQDHSGDDLLVALFVCAAWAQAVWAWLVTARRDRWVLYLGIALGGGLILVWAVSRTVGIEIGTHLDGPEPVGLKDGVTVAFELLTIAGAVWLLARERDGIRISSLAVGRRALGILGAAVFAISVPAFLASSHSGGHGRHAVHRGAQAGDAGESLSERERARELRRIERLEGLR